MSEYQYEYIKDTYGVALYAGKRGEHKGRPFKVVGASNYIKVQFSGSKEKSNLHPMDDDIKWEVEE